MAEYKNYITPEGYAALEKEFQQLVKTERPELVKIISWAAGNGDRSENGDYIYGKKRLRQIDSRIRFLTKRMDAAEIVYSRTQTNLEKVYHGVATKVKITVPDHVLFKDLADEIEVGRYHSWVVSNENFPDVLEITSVDDNGQIMSLRHKTYDVRGVQYHPESVLTPNGKKILENWVNS